MQVEVTSNPWATIAVSQIAVTVYQPQTVVTVTHPTQSIFTLPLEVLQGPQGPQGPAGSDATVNAANVGSVVHGVDSKTPPVDADELPLWDSVGSALKKLTWANLKTALASVFAPAMQLKTSDFTAENGSRNRTVGASITCTDPAPSANGCYVVRVDSGTCVIGGVVYSPSRFDIIRYYNGATWTTQTAVITGGLSVDGLTRKLLASYTVPQASALTGCTYDSATKTFTCSAHGLVNGTVVKLVAGTGALPTGFTAFTSELLSTVYYVVGKTDNTFKLSTSYGGSAVTTSDSGTLGWIATPIGSHLLTISGLSIGDGVRFRVRFESSNGVGYANGASGVSLQINGDATAKYRYSTTDNLTYLSVGCGGNLYAMGEWTLTNRGGIVAGIFSHNSNSGTARDAANSTPTGSLQACAYDSETASLAITSIVFNEIGSGSKRTIKPGTIITIEQEA